MTHLSPPHPRRGSTPRRRVPRAGLALLLAVSGAVGTVAGVSSPASASSPAPSDYLCYVAGSGQQTSVTNAFAGYLEVELSTTACSAPTADASTGLSVSFSVVTSPGGPSATFSPSANAGANGGLAYVVAYANSVVGAYSVTATSSAAPGQSVSFYLDNVAGPPATITAGVGASQSTPVGSAFPLQLAVTVQDSSKNPVVASPVTFSVVAPGAASGTFSTTGSTSTTVYTDSSGVAVAPPLIANDAVGGFAVTASVPGYTAVATFALVNDATATFSVQAVTPSLLVRGARDATLVVSGTGFTPGDEATFSTPAITVQSVTDVTPTTLRLRVTVRPTAPTGPSSLTVTSPDGATVTGANVLLVTPAVTEPAPAPVLIRFAATSTALSATARLQLTVYLDTLVSGATVRLTSAAAPRGLARARARAVDDFLRARLARLRVTLVSSPAGPRDAVRVVTTAN